MYKNLDILREALTNTEALSDAEKLDFQSEIETIQSQLSKEIPNKTIISQAWSTLSKVATVDGLMNVYERAKMFIIPLIS